MNYVLDLWGAGASPFSAEEVARRRAAPVPDVVALRRDLAPVLERAGLSIAPYPWPRAMIRGRSSRERFERREERREARLRVKVLILIVGAVFALTFLTLPGHGGGWFWDLGGALGYLGFAGLLFQMIPRARGPRVGRHEMLGYGVLAVVLAHAFWLIAGDGTVRFYLLPGAPLYMWLGLAAALGLCLLTVLARMPDRMKVHRRFQGFRFWHRVIAALVVVTALIHIVLSGFYLPYWWQAAGLALLALGMSLGRPYWARLSAAPTARLGDFAAAGGVAVAAFVLIRSLIA
ncbi:hypothetical protein JCM7686_pAMI4p068 (plasmid) [Paracoccus aminophilus JCM 7686]|uniref:Ferric oxidoreductase domain-containing protein n=1 Tax=Paracoccus aminophilus JCM 7686 TaxID=1367847 RepID=S5XTD5_PARAH|nr:hypothetical protein JCM7686_pAMI4p068 [Paracoccus aminophilus JCM 7686]